MAKLSRMERYADLRKHLENDGDIEVTNSALDTFKEQLDELEGLMVADAEQNIASSRETLNEVVEEVVDEFKPETSSIFIDVDTPTVKNDTTDILTEMFDKTSELTVSEEELVQEANESLDELIEEAHDFIETMEEVDTADDLFKTNEKVEDNLAQIKSDLDAFNIQIEDGLTLDASSKIKENKLVNNVEQVKEDLANLNIEVPELNMELPTKQEEIETAIDLPDFDFNTEVEEAVEINIEEPVSEVNEDIHDFAEDVEDAVNDIHEDFTSDLDTVREEDIDFIDRLKDGWQDFKEEVKEDASEFKEEVGEFFEEKKEDVTEFVEEKKENVEEFNEGVGEFFEEKKEEAEDNFEEFKEDVAETKEEVADFFEEKKENLEEGVENAVENVEEFNEEVKEEVGEFFEEKKEEVEEDLNNIKQEVAEDFAEVKDEATEVKEEVIEEINDDLDINENVEFKSDGVIRNVVDLNTNVVETPDSTVELNNLMSSINDFEDDADINVMHNENDYLQQTLDEVNQYNKDKGLMTADDVPGRIADEMREEDKTPTEVKEEVVETTVVEEDDDNPFFADKREMSADEQDINDTVTMEIHNILAAIEAEESAPVEAEVNTPSATEKEIINKWMGAQTYDTKTTDISALKDKEDLSSETVDMLRPYLNEEENKGSVERSNINAEEKLITPISVSQPEVKEEHPVLTKTLEETETVEENLGDTRSFVIDQTRAEYIREPQQEEEESGNKVLDFVLIILVIALIAILAVIAYGLLKTMGIVG